MQSVSPPRAPFFAANKIKFHHKHFSRSLASIATKLNFGGRIFICFSCRSCFLFSAQPSHWHTYTLTTVSHHRHTCFSFFHLVRLRTLFIVHMPDPTRRRPSPPPADPSPGNTVRLRPSSDRHDLSSPLPALCWSNSRPLFLYKLSFSLLLFFFFFSCLFWLATFCMHTSWFRAQLTCLPFRVHRLPYTKWREIA